MTDKEKEIRRRQQEEAERRRQEEIRRRQQEEAERRRQEEIRRRQEEQRRIDEEIRKGNTNDDRPDRND